MNNLRLASQARKVEKLQKELDKETEILNVALGELQKEAKQYGLTLWTSYHDEDKSYFWENKHKQVANYPTLQEAILAYGSEQIDFE